MGRRPIRVEVREAVLKALQEDDGALVRDVAAQYNVSVPTVYKWLKEKVVVGNGGLI